MTHWRSVIWGNTGMLHRATADARIADLDLLPPTLDELYAHFLRGGIDGWR